MIPNMIRVDNDIIPDKTRYTHPITTPHFLIKNEAILFSFYAKRLKSKKKRYSYLDLLGHVPLSQPSIAVAFRRLELRGYLEGERNKNCGRLANGKLRTSVMEYFLTEKGKKFLKANLTKIEELANDRKDQHNVREEATSN